MSILILLLIPFIGAFIGLYLGTLKELYRDLFNIMLTVFALIWTLSLFPYVKEGVIDYYLPDIMGTGLYLKMDMLQYFLCLLTAIIWTVVTIYSPFYLTKHRNRNRYYFCYMLTYSFTLGIFMSENLLNLFTFFEAMTFSSYVLVIHDEDEFSHRAGLSYIAMAITGGLVMLMGILVAFDYTQTLIIGELVIKLAQLDTSIQGLIGGLILFGFGVKSAMFPLHTWLSKAYVASPTPATAVLSGILMKIGLYGMLLTSTILISNQTLSYGLIVLGVVNMLFGGFLAMNQRNIKRIVAYSSMSQAGFMIVGIGLIGLLKGDSGLAYAGTTLYMINHAFSKVLLFLVVGIILYWIKELSLTQIWGFGRKQLFLKGLFLIGVLGTIGFPGFNGYTSKTLLHEAIVEARHLIHPEIFLALEAVYYLASALTVAYMLKLYIALFVSKNKHFDEQPVKKMSINASLPLIALAVGIFILGLMPKQILEPLLHYLELEGRPIHGELHFFTTEALISAFGIIAAGLMIYLLYVRRYLVIEEQGERVYLNRMLNWLDIEEDLYRPLVSGGFKGLTKVFDFVDTWLTKVVITVKYFYVYLINIDSQLLKKLEWDRSIIDTSTDVHRYEIKDDMTVHKTGLTLKESFLSFYSNITSINYTVLFVASILVIVMGILFLVR